VIEEVGLVEQGVCLKLLVLTVIKSVRFHLNLQWDDQFIVVNASQNIDVLKGEGREKDVDLDVDVNLGDREKCIKQFAVTAKKSVKYLSNLLRGNPFIVTSVGKNIGLPEDTDRLLCIYPNYEH
jgi:hypothetical protein